MNYYKRREDSRKAIARRRVDDLFEKADTWFERDKKVSNEMIKTAYAIKQKFNLSFTKIQKLRFCKECLSYLKQGKNVRVRTGDGKTTLTCLNCGHIQRYGYTND